MIFILLLGAFLRFHALHEDVRFHPDEALFATFARNAAVHGDWMLSGALDKTPLSIYGAALSMHLTGVYVNEKNVLDLDLKHGEFSARLPNVFAGIVLIALVYSAGKTLYNENSGRFAALLIALSPQLTAFSATAFTDMLMLVLMIASLTMAVQGRPLWSGIWLALSVWSKQQGVFYLPLVLWYVTTPSLSVTAQHDLIRLPMSHAGAQYTAPLQTIHALLRFMIGFVPVIALLLLWDSARQETSIFTLAAVNNNPERLFVRLDELLPRLWTWLRYFMTFFGVWWVTLVLVITGISGIIRNAKRILPVRLYVLAYFLLHWLLAFNTYDRYLLPIMPLMALMVGRGIMVLTEGVKLGSVRYAPTSMAGILLCAAALLAPIAYPTDSRPRDLEIIKLADYLNAKPLGAIIYDHWLGWEMGYYIGAWSDKRRVYYPEPEIQAEDALLNPDPAPRYFIAPVEQEVSAWLDAFAKHGFSIQPVYRNNRYIVYQITPAWCC